jgi:DNA repair exonuclease SbcCD ATPase subunit
MLIPKSLTFCNIGRFITPQTIDFTQLGDLVQVDGQNNCSGGSSGAGKSTIFKALSWLLGLDGPSTNILQSRLTKEHIEVSAIFDFDGQTLKIERGRKLLIDLDGEITTGSSKLTEEKLDNILAMPRDLFSKILHKEQGSRGFFLDMGASDTHKFLTSCLKLEEEQKKILKLDEILKTLSGKEIVLKSEIESNKMGLEASKSALNSLGTAPIPFFDHSETLKQNHDRASHAYNESKSAYETEKLELEKSRPIIAVSPFDRSQIESIETEIKEIAKKTSELESAELARQSEVKSQISYFQLEISNIQKSEQSRQSEITSKIAANRLEHNKAINLVKQGDRAKEEAKRLAAELNKIRTSICPTCEQNWITDSIKTKEADILKKLGEYRLVVIAGTDAHKTTLSLDEEHKSLLSEAFPRTSPEIDSLNSRIEQWKAECAPRAISEVIELKMKSDFKNQELKGFRQQERDHQFKENDKNQVILAEFAQKQTFLTQKHESVIKSLLDIKNKAHSEYELFIAKQRSFEAEVKRYSDSLSKLNTQIVNYESMVNQKSTDLISIQEEIEILEESKKAIKSHLSCSFDDALESIGDKATRLIRLIPNMSNATIQFEGTKETAAGKVKEEVVCMVSMDGEIGVPLKSLSGGERSSCDMCVDLSIIKFIEETTGKGIGIYIIDEGFNGLDTTCIQDALEMLREYSVDKKLFLVEHNPIVSESIENKILVVRDGLTSKIIQQ